MQKYKALMAQQVGNTPMRRAITIPDNTGLGSTFRALFIAAGLTQDQTDAIIGFKIPPRLLGFVVANPMPGVAIQASDYTTHGQAVADIDLYYEPADLDLDSYVRSASGSAVTALAVIYW
jgi:hypothetical protein